MSNKEKEKQEGFRAMDKPMRSGKMNEELSEELKERTEEHSEMIREKATEARETIDSQSYEGRKGQKGLNKRQ